MKPVITLIAAMAENRVIGRDGKVPWHIPEDLRRFREVTMGHPLIVGRRTFESIGRPLPGRTMIVLTRQVHFRPPECQVARDLDEAIALAGETDEIFIAGGGTIYRQALPLADRVLLTLVPGVYEGDAFFPELPADFVEISREEVPGVPGYLFLTYERGRR